MARFGKLSYGQIQLNLCHLLVIKTFYHTSIKNWQQNHTIHSDLGKNEVKIQESTGTC